MNKVMRVIALRENYPFLSIARVGLEIINACNCVKNVSIHKAGVRSTYNVKAMAPCESFSGNQNICNVRSPAALIPLILPLSDDQDKLILILTGMCLQILQRVALHSSGALVIREGYQEFNVSSLIRK